MSGSTSGTVTFHVGRVEDVPLTFTLAGASVSAVAGGTLTVADTSIATAVLSADDSVAKFTGVAVGSTTASYTNSSGGDVLDATITLEVIADPTADGVTFDSSAASEEPASSTGTTAAAPAPAPAATDPNSATGGGTATQS